MHGRVSVIPGERVDRYLVLWSLSPEIEGFPGGRTFQALDEETGARVILQVAEVDISALAGYEVALERARKVVLPAMPGLFGGGIDVDRAYLATGWIPGVSLSDMAHAASVDPRTGTALLWVLAGALAQLHANGLNHGDVHPRNIRISPQGQPYLVGFMPGPFAQPQTTIPVEVPLPRYAAPEFYVLDELGPPGDIYSLGLVGYQLLTTRELLPAGRARDMPAHQERMATALEQAGSLGWRVPEALEALLRRMLQVRVPRRMKDGAALVEEMLKAWPSSADVGWLPRSLREHFIRARSRAARRLLDEAGFELARDALIPAAACLRAIAELELEAYSDEVDEAREIIVGAAWKGLVAEPGPAFWLLLHDAADELGDEALASNTLRLLRDTNPEAPAYTRALKGLGSAPPVAQRVELARARLEEAPLDPRAMLELALCMTPQARGDARSVSALQGAVLASQGFFRQAMAARARELPRTEHPLALIDEIEVLMDAARREALGSSQSAPPRWRSPSHLDELLREDTSAPPKPTDMVLSFPGAEPETIFEEGRRCLSREQLDEAAQLFAQLLEMEEAVRDQFHARVCDSLRELMWRALAKSQEGSAGLALMRGIWELARKLELRELDQLGENLLVAALPIDGADQAVDELVQRDPTSIRFRQAAAMRALSRADLPAWAGHLVAAGHTFLIRRDLLSATKVLMAARSHADAVEVGELSGGMFALAEEIAAASAAYQDLQSGLPEDDPGAALASCVKFMGEYRGYRPVIEVAVEYAIDSGATLQASEWLMDLAREAIFGEELDEAREILRRVLGLEFENDQALLYLASIEPPPPEAAAQGPDGMRLAVLRREGLLEAAIYRARSLLRGGKSDRWLHEVLVELAIETGGDASPHLFTLATMALEAGEHANAAAYVSRCLECGGEPGLVLTLVSGSSELQSLLPRDELMDLMLDGGKA